MYRLRSILCPIRQFYKNVSPAIHQKNIPASVVKQFRLYFRQYSVANFEDESEKIIDDICKGNAELEKKLRIIMLEVELRRQDGQSTPDHLQMKHWQHLLDLSSRNQRKKFLSYLFTTEKFKEIRKARREERKKKFQESYQENRREYPDDLIYGLSDQSLFLRIRDECINNFDNYRTLQAMQYGQSVVLDCSYDEHMVYREAANAAKQMTFVFGKNRINKEPFNIHLCNINWDGAFMRQLETKIPTVRKPWFPLNLHTESYLDIFPKDKLVYLTPHCRQELTTFDHDAIYIVGCMVNKRNTEPFSLEKAKRDGIKMAKLPLDRYLTWAPGTTKSLNINRMFPILLDLKQTGDWEFALRHVPRRKLMKTNILAMSKTIKNKSLQRDVLNNFNKVNKQNFRNRKLGSRKSLYYDDESI